MSQTQTPTRFAKQGRMRNYIPASDTFAGDIVVIGTSSYLAPLDIPSGTLGALHVDGVWSVPKDASTFVDGDPVYWNATGNPTIGTAGTGAAPSSSAGNVLMGQCVT